MTDNMKEDEEFLLEPTNITEELILDESGEHIVNIIPIKNRVLFNYTLNMKLLTRQEYVLRLVTVIEKVEERIIPPFITFKEVLKRFAYGTARLNEVQLALDNCKDYLIQDVKLQFKLSSEDDWYKMSFAISSAVAETMVDPLLFTIKVDIDELSNIKEPDTDALEYLEHIKKILVMPRELISFQTLNEIIYLTIENKLDQLNKIERVK